MVIHYTVLTTLLTYMFSNIHVQFFFLLHIPTYQGDISQIFRRDLLKKWPKLNVRPCWSKPIEATMVIYQVTAAMEVQYIHELKRILKGAKSEG